MGLSRLLLRDLRCFDAIDLTFSANTNLIVGDNASGKTSLLEAIFILGRGRSFRTGHLETATRSGASAFQVTGRVATHTGPVSIGLIRENGLLQAQVEGKPPGSFARLAEIFPVQLIDSQAHLLINGSPRYRRQFLDWGVFHVEPVFFPAWQRYHRILRQRNTLLHTGKPSREIASWDVELGSCGEILDASRRAYLSKFSLLAAGWAERALGKQGVSLGYYPGWPEGQSLPEALKESAERDRRMASTQVGPHRADFLIRVAGKPARERISRGQEKTLAGALLLAQAGLYRTIRGRACTLLLDDLASELDAGHLSRFLEMVDETSAQVFLTALRSSSIMLEYASKVFHVKQGKISEMVQ